MQSAGSLAVVNFRVNYSWSWSFAHIQSFVHKFHLKYQRSVSYIRGLMKSTFAVCMCCRWCLILWQLPDIASHKTVIALAWWIFFIDLWKWFHIWKLLSLDFERVYLVIMSVTHYNIVFLCICIIIIQKILGLIFFQSIFCPVLSTLYYWIHNYYLYLTIWRPGATVLFLEL